MPTYYKEGDDTICRIAASRMTYEAEDGTIHEVDLAAEGGGDPVTWDTISGKPAVVASGLNKLGARSTIDAAKFGANTDITSLGGLTTPLSAAQGGTGVTSLVNLGAALNIAAFTSGLAPAAVNLDTLNLTSLGSMTTSTVGRPTGTVDGDLVMSVCTATTRCQFALLTGTDKLVFRTYDVSGSVWRAWKDVTATAL